MRTASNILFCTLLGCSRPLGYNAPSRWAAIRINTPSAASPTILVASRYQIEVCENIADRYDELAETSASTGRWVNVVAPLIAAVGTAMTGFADFASDGTETGLKATGVSLALFGAGWTASNLIAGSGRVEPYSTASGDLRTAVNGFREFFEADALADERVAARLCSLRSRCYRRQVGAAPVGHAFEPRGDAAAVEIANRRLLLQGYLAGLCSSDAELTARCTRALTAPSLQAAGPSTAGEDQAVCLAAVPLSGDSGNAAPTSRDPNSPTLRAQ